MRVVEECFVHLRGMRRTLGAGGVRCRCARRGKYKDVSFVFHNLEFRV